MIDSYKKSVETLTSQGKFYISLGLDRVSCVLNLLGNPQDKIKVVHVAGTNGKGSTCSILANILDSAGYKVGLYTSPHLFEYTERVKISGVEIEKTVFAQYVDEICKLAEKNKVHLTEFEILTVIAYKYFADSKVDLAIMEVGLGGRLDATNVIKNNLCSIIASVSIDHIDRLGDSIEKIAFEKAGIIKEKCDVIVDESNSGFKVIEGVAHSKNANTLIPDMDVDLSFEDGRNFANINGEKYEFNLLGLWQKNNLKLVLKAIECLRNKGFKVSLSALKNGLKTVTWPARLQYVKRKNLIIDGAHNADAAKKLRESLDYYFPEQKRTWIYGSLNTKEYKKVVKTLFRLSDTVYFFHFNNKNAICSDAISSEIEAPVFDIKLPEAENILNKNSKNSVTIVSGSFYMIGEIFKSINL